MKQKAALTILMLCSGLLLCAFLGFWLRTEWQSEKRALEKDLQARFMDVTKRVGDSVLRVRIVRPFVEGQKATTGPFRVFINDSAVSRVPAGMQLRPTVTIRSTVTRDESDSVRRRIDTTVVNMLEGVRVFMNDAFPDSLQRFFSHGDTAQVRRILGGAVAAEHQRFDLSWKTAEGQDTGALILLHSEQRSHMPALAVNHYKSYLLRKIAPQILFALALAGITVLAFLLAWRSLQRERRLALMRNSLVSNMSHELKTPVTTVKLALEALGEEAVLQDRETVREYVDMAAQELQRLELLINGTLHSSLMESGRLPMQPAPVDLRGLAEQLVESLRLRIRKAQAELRLSFGEGDFTVAADKLHVQGVLLNILDNALKYGGDVVRIQIAGTAAADSIRIAVSDDGPGIPAAYHGRVFEKFFRVPTGNLHSVKGYGLGLSYAAEVMRLHGGAISLSNNDGRGSIFTLQFPKEPTS